MSVTIIYENREPVAAGAVTTGDDLWVDRSALADAIGWELKPEGLCRGEVCVPIPLDREDDFLDDGGARFNVAAFARLRGQPAARDSSGRAWAFGYAVAERRTASASLQAPDFTLPDLEGNPHSLSAYRGRKVLLLSWASW